MELLDENIPIPQSIIDMGDYYLSYYKSTNLKSQELMRDYHAWADSPKNVVRQRKFYNSVMRELDIVAHVNGAKYSFFGVQEMTDFKINIVEDIMMTASKNMDRFRNCVWYYFLKAYFLRAMPFFTKNYVVNSALILESELSKVMAGNEDEDLFLSIADNMPGEYINQEEYVYLSQLLGQYAELINKSVPSVPDPTVRGVLRSAMLLCISNSEFGILKHSRLPYWLRMAAITQGNLVCNSLREEIKLTMSEYRSD